MARRATFIKSLRATEAGRERTLVLGAPFEILPDGPDRRPDARRLPAISQALTLTGYTAGALLPDEAAYLKSAQAPIPAGFTVADTTPRTTVVEAAGTTIGIVFFPPPPDLTKPAPPAIGDAVAKAARELRTKAKLVIGLSGLGMMDEEAFLTAHPDALDVLLGSGINAGNAGKAGPGGKTLWARAYTRGKTVNRLDLLALPGAADFTWTPNGTFKAEVINLDETFPADPDIKKLFE
ncbi:hypothetical protein DVDV_2218 [Desulfovibrio sp. DV]|uniref:UshA-like (seleno)protein family 2 n=1 Tax=Desulfovibrio sp. DV TaxID=1844708 RepID=UPI00094BB617|nr:hypothetical protein [Desulfovibrio sp. DV]OLN27252.1 hypothetical protein DVDV_2218 [Desulfovibrio sp. DV]